MYFMNLWIDVYKYKNIATCGDDWEEIICQTSPSVYVKIDWRQMTSFAMHFRDWRFWELRLKNSPTVAEVMLSHRSWFVMEIRFDSVMWKTTRNCNQQTSITTVLPINFNTFFSFFLFQNCSKRFLHNPEMASTRCSSKLMEWFMNKTRTCLVSCSWSSKVISSAGSLISPTWWTNSSISFIRKCSQSSTVIIISMMSKFQACVNFKLQRRSNQSSNIQVNTNS